MRRVLTVLGVLLVVLVAGVAWYLRPIAPIATGYAAQIVCGAVHLQGRTVEAGLDDLPANPLVPFLRVEAGEDDVQATLLGLAGSRAVAEPGNGCRLVDDGSPDVQQVAAVEPGADDLVVPGDPTAAAAAAGLDVEELQAAVAAAFAEDLPDDAVKATRAVVVVHDGQVVAEEYGEGFGPDTPLLGWSMGKSMAHAVVGRLVLDGALAVDEDDLWPGWTGDDPRRAITLQQMLEMTDGLAFEEVYDPDTDATRMLFTPGDAGAYAADQPLVADPGTRWSYSSGTTNIVCDVAAGRRDAAPEALLHDLLFAPLSMTTATMGLDGAGDPVCSSFPYASARDWARFGQLYLQDGVWAGERLLPEGWAGHAATPVELETSEDGEVTPYGAHWWLNADAQGRTRLPDAPADAYWASGNEGQQVVVLPSHDTVVVRLGLSRGVGGPDWGLGPLLAGVVDALP